MKKPNYMDTLKQTFITTTVFSYGFNVYFLFLGNNDDQFPLIAYAFMLILLATHWLYYFEMFIFNFRKFKSGYTDAGTRYRRFRYLTWAVSLAIIYMLFVITDYFFFIFD
jgi:hypothetical protein